MEHLVSVSATDVKTKSASIVYLAEDSLQHPQIKDYLVVVFSFDSFLIEEDHETSGTTLGLCICVAISNVYNPSLHSNISAKFFLAPCVGWGCTVCHEAPAVCGQKSRAQVFRWQVESPNVALERKPCFGTSSAIFYCKAVCIIWW